MIIILIQASLLPLPLLLSLLAAPLPDSASQAWVAREAYVMGTTLRVTLAAPDRTHAILAIEEVFAEVRRLDAVLSTWREDSELAALNRAEAGRPVPLSRELAGLLAESAEWSRATAGAFDPGIGPLVDAWDLRGSGRVPSREERLGALRLSGLARFELTPTSGTRLVRGAWLDTGAFGKGAALRAAARRLGTRGIADAMLNFGGQILALGRDESGRPWRVPVSHPARRQEAAAWLRVQGRSISTSSQSERWVTAEGRRMGHVLDPRTGAPVAPWGSVTVAAEDPVTADILSTALLVLGPEEALRWSARRADVGVLVLEQRGERLVPRWNRAMARHLVTDTTSITGG